MAERYLVTSALPYVNNIPHLGNLIGSVLPADVFSRWLRMRGKDVLYICGTDEHGTPITVSARKEGTTPRQLADKYHAIIRDCFARFDIRFDNFSRTTRPVHYEMTTRFFERLDENGFILKQDMELPFCPACAQFLADRYVEGRCPKCGAEGARGDQCDACQSVLDPSDLVEPYCVVCRTRPEWRTTAHWFLDLPKLSGELEAWLATKTDWPDNARNFPLGWIRAGLKPRAITRDLEWGVPVPLEDARGKVLYVWFDAPIGYISATIEWARNAGRPEAWRDYWYGGEARLIHFLGKDNVPFHTIIWPGMLIGTREGFNLPHHIASFEYLNYGGQKFSKSRGVGIWVDQALAMHPADYWRYALIANAPQSRDTDFSLDELRRRVNDELADILGNFVHRTLTFVQRFHKGSVPPAERLGDSDRAMLEQVVRSRGEVDACLERYDLKGALHAVMMLAKEGNRYFNERAPWEASKRDPASAAATINVCTQVVASLAVLCSPFIPASAQRMWESVGGSGRAEDQPWDVAPSVPAGRALPVPAPLFAKIEEAKAGASPAPARQQAAARPPVAAGIPATAPPPDRAGGGAAVAAAPPASAATLAVEAGGARGAAAPAPPERAAAVKEGGKAMITIDDFGKLDLRVGVVVSAQRVEGAKKLLRLMVDVGEPEPRQLVAGVAEQYGPDALVGKRIVVLANLKPATIRGIESKGMLLAAEKGETVTLLTVDGDIGPGAKVA